VHTVTHACVLIITAASAVATVCTLAELRRPPLPMGYPQYDALEKPDPKRYDERFWEHIVSY
jgi:hypothetical protein